MKQTQRITLTSSTILMGVLAVGLSAIFLTLLFRTPYLDILRKRADLNAEFRNMSVWAISDSYKIMRDGTLAMKHPLADYRVSNSIWSDAEKKISITSLKRETRGVQIGIDAHINLSGVDVAVSDLTSPAGTIPASSLTLFYEWYLRSPYQDVPRQIGSLPAGSYPDALIPFTNPYSTTHERIVHPFSLSNGVTQPVWLDIKIPETAAAGAYEGTVTVSATGQTPIELTLEVTVLDATVPVERPIAVDIGLNKGSFTTAMELGTFSLTSRTWPTTWQAYVKVLHLARDHGFDTTPFLNSIEPAITTDANNNVTAVDWSRYDAYIGSILNGSIFPDGEPPAAWALPIKSLGNYETAPTTLSAADEQYIRTLAPFVESHFREKGWDLTRSFAMAIDEPTPDQYPAIIQYGQALKLGSNLRLMETEQPGVGALNDVVDFWITHGVDYFPTQMQERQAAGETTWFYQSQQPSLGTYTINAEAVDWRVWPWSAWKYGADGIMYWSGTYWDPTQPLVKPDARSADQGWGIGEGTLFYPGKKLDTIGFSDIDGPLPSTRMKVLRRGLLDTQLFQMLTELGDEQFAKHRVTGIVRSSLCTQYDPTAPWGTPPRFYCPPHWQDERWLNDPEHAPEWERNPERWDETVQTIRLRINELLHPIPSNNPPVLDAIGTQTVAENQTLTFTVSATDPDAGDSLTYSATNLPEGATFDTSTHAFNWVTDYDDAGEFPDVTFTVTDSHEASDSESITITVENVNRAPVLSTIGPKSVYEEQEITFDVTAADPDGDDLVYSASNLPDGAAFDTITHVFSWTPRLDQSGIYPDIHFQVADVPYGEIDAEDIAITVHDVDRTAPVISNVQAVAQQNRAVITWTTDENSTSQVEYGRAQVYGSMTTPDGRFVTIHRVVITGLQPGTRYNYRVKSKDSSGNEGVSTNYTFMTSRRQSL